MKYGDHEALLAHQNLERAALISTRCFVAIYFAVMSHVDSYPPEKIEEIRETIRLEARNEWGEKAFVKFFPERVRVEDGAARETDIFKDDKFPDFPNYYD